MCNENSNIISACKNIFVCYKKTVDKRAVLSYTIPMLNKQHSKTNQTLRGIIMNTTTNIMNIQDLFMLMRDSDPSILDVHGQFRSDLPVFSDKEPGSTMGIWSYDDRYAIIGTCSEDIRLVPRNPFPDAKVPYRSNPSHVELEIDKDERIRQYADEEFERLTSREHTFRDEVMENVVEVYWNEFAGKVFSVTKAFLHDDVDDVTESTFDLIQIVLKMADDMARETGIEKEEDDYQNSRYDKMVANND